MLQTRQIAVNDAPPCRIEHLPRHTWTRNGAMTKAQQTRRAITHVSEPNDSNRCRTSWLRTRVLPADDGEAQSSVRNCGGWSTIYV